jgi:hypothetical protein
MAAITIPHHWIKPGESFNATCGADMTAIATGGGGYSCVIQNGTTGGQVIQSAAADTIVLGFLQEVSATEPKSGDQVTVYYSGIVWAVAAGAIAYMAPCESAAAGRVQAAASTDYMVGISLSPTTTGAGDRFPLMIRFQLMA